MQLQFSDILSIMLQGTMVTLKLFFITLIFSIPIGFALTLCYLSKNKVLKAITGFYILIMRGTPLLLQMFFIYYWLPYMPIVGEFMVFKGFEACAVAFILNYAAYFAEIFRGGLLSVDKGQYEASKVLGLSKFQTLSKIIIPQTIKVSLPPISNEAIILVKDTALITALAQPDLLHVTQGIVNQTANISIFGVAAIFYLLISYVLTVIFRKLEKKFMFE